MECLTEHAEFAVNGLTLTNRGLKLTGIRREADRKAAAIRGISPLPRCPPIDGSVTVFAGRTHTDAHDDD
jgi:hypothetical protein